MGANVGAALEKSGEAVAKGVAADVLGNPGSPHGQLDGLLHGGLIQVVAAGNSSAGVD